MQALLCFIVVAFIISCVYTQPPAKSTLPPGQTLVTFTSAEVEQNGARCLDGSYFAFYYQNATTEADANKWYFFMEGGGFCIPNATEQSGTNNCYDRETERLGSNKTLANGGWPSIPIPDFASTWNFVIVPYCSQDFFSGRTRSMVKSLYFAGHLSVIAMIQKLKSSYGFNHATEVILSGASAGATGVFVNVDYFKTAVPHSATLLVYPNAGWFLPYMNWDPLDLRNKTLSRQILYNDANSYVNQACAAGQGQNAYLCFFGSITWPYAQQLNLSWFFAQSIFDSSSLLSYVDNYGGYKFTNPEENQWIVNFGATLRASISRAIIPGNGIFLSSATEHVLKDYTEKISGTTLQQAITNWYTKTGNYTIVSTCAKPDCNGSIPLH